MKKITFIFIIISISFFIGCKKTNTLDETFCTFIHNKDFDKSKPIVDRFLSTLSTNLTSSQKLEKLAQWYKSQSCIVNAEIICNSCIDTYPSMSEIKIFFENSNGTIETKIADIYMSTPLTLKTHHD